MLDRAAYFRRWAELHGGYDPAGSVLVSRWLTGAYAVARRGSGVPPLAVTAAALAAAIAVPVLAHQGGSGLLVAASFAAVLSGFLDSLDGAVAVVHGRDTRIGYVLDSTADRLADSAYVVALWLLGAPGWLCIVAGAAAALQEYVRARAAMAGMREIGVVTVFERPTRVILAALTILACAALTGSADLVATIAAVAWVVLAGVGLGQLFLTVRRLT